MVVNVHREGTGEPLLLLHGIGMRWQWWAPCLPALARSHEVIAMDFPGFGASPPLASTPSPPALTDAVAALIDDLGDQRPHVAGISLGGLVALELARRGRVRSATAISPAGFGRSWERAWLDGSLRATHRFALAAAPYAERLLAPAAARRAVIGQVAVHGDRVPAAELAAHLHALAASDFSRTRAALVPYDFEPGPAPSVPVTIAWGGRDALLFPWQAKRALARIPGARLVRLRGAGHVPTYDDPEAVVRAVLGTAGAARDRDGERGRDRDGDRGRDRDRD